MTQERPGIDCKYPEPTLGYQKGFNNGFDAALAGEEQRIAEAVLAEHLQYCLRCLNPEKFLVDSKCPRAFELERQVEGLK